MFYHLVAVANHGVIGLNKMPPWYIASDLRYFKNLTESRTIIMSHASFSLFGHKYSAKKFMLVGRNAMSLKTALTETQDESQVYIAGGLSIYEQTMDIINGIYMARIFKDYQGDKFYPKIPSDIKMKWATQTDRGAVLFYYERDWKYDQ